MSELCERCSDRGISIPATVYVEGIGMHLCDDCYAGISEDIAKELSKQKRGNVVVAVSKRYRSMWMGFIKERSRGMMRLGNATHVMVNSNSTICAKLIKEIFLREKNYVIMER